MKYILGWGAGIKLANSGSRRSGCSGGGGGGARMRGEHGWCQGRSAVGCVVRWEGGGGPCRPFTMTDRVSLCVARMGLGCACVHNITF